MLIAAILSLGLGMLMGSAYAQDASAGEPAQTEAGTQQSASETQGERSPAANSPEVERGRVYGGELQEVDPAVASARMREEAPTPWGIFSKVLVFLIVLTGITYGIVHYARKGKLNLGALRAYSAEDRLIVSETRMLGNRQYLMVVEYGDQKMLLGVAPGSIQHLCFLESGYQDEVEAAMEETYQSEEEETL